MPPVARADLPRRFARGEREIRSSHLTHEFVEARARRPAELLAREARVAEQVIYLGRTVVLRMDAQDDLAGFDLGGGVIDTHHDGMLVDTRPAKFEFDAHLARGEQYELA